MFKMTVSAMKRFMDYMNNVLYIAYETDPMMFTAGGMYM